MFVTFITIVSLLFKFGTFHHFPYFYRDTRAYILDPSIQEFWFQKFNKYLGKLVHKYNFRIVDSEPNKCAGKREDGQRTYYTFNDVLLIKS